MTSDYTNVNSKLKEALLYVLQSFEDIEEVGMTKLSKLLYFADFNYYKENFEPITGETYIREDHGPLATELYDAVEVLKDEGRLFAEKKPIENNVEKWVFEVQDSPEFQTLDESEKRTLSEVVSRLGNLSSSELAELSHEDNPWQVTEPMEPINYDLVFYRSEEVEEKVE
ncbi:MAG: Panacea domain-containing protein [Candidatus Nanohaloarchaea archaeon]